MVTGIEIEHPRPAKEWLFLPALGIVALVVFAQRRRDAVAPTVVRASTRAGI